MGALSKSVLAIAAAGACCAVAENAFALENGLSNFPAGSTGTNISSFPPIPGIFVLDQTNYSSADGLYGNDGRKLPIPFKFSSVSNTPRFLISYPFVLPGDGHLYSQIVLPIVSLNSEIFGHKSYTSGLANTTISPLIASWALAPDLVTTMGLDIALPTGAYSQTKASVATGYASIIPVLAMRYTVPDGIDLGIANRLMANLKNTHTNYRSGDAYIADFQAGWNFGPLKLGAVGGFLDQFNNDVAAGDIVQPGGDRERTLSIGPSLTYAGHLGPVPFNINVNYQFGVYADNTSKSNNLWVNIAIPLFVPNAPPPRPGSPSGG